MHSVTNHNFKLLIIIHNIHIKIFIHIYRATDADLDANAAIRYAIIGGNTQMQFSIDSLSGDVSLVKPLDYEQVRSYRLVIRAQGKGDTIF